MICPLALPRQPDGGGPYAIRPEDLRPPACRADRQSGLRVELMGGSPLSCWCQEPRKPEPAAGPGSASRRWSPWAWASSAHRRSPRRRVPRVGAEARKRAWWFSSCGFWYRGAWSQHEENSRRFVALPGRLRGQFWAAGHEQVGARLPDWLRCWNMPGTPGGRAPKAIGRWPLRG